MDDDAWFAPKRYGIGGGLPIAWQGWALLGLYVLLLAGAAWLMLARRSFAAGIILALVATIVLVAVAAAKTRGGWRWRWGED